MRRVTSRTVLASEPPPRASAPCVESSSASAAPPTRLAAPRASRRAMRRTDFCLLTSSYEHPRLVGSRCVMRLRAPQPGRSPVSRQSDSLRWAAPLSFGCHRDGRVVPFAMRADRTSGIPVASPPADSPLARRIRPRKSPRPSRPIRVNDAGRERRSGTPSIEQGPSPRDALSSARLRTSPALRLGHRYAGSRPLFTRRGPLRTPGGPGSRSRIPAANGSRFSEPRRRLPISAT